MNITIKVGTDCIDWQQLFCLYKEVGLVAGLARKKDFEGIKKAFCSTFKVVTAWDGEKLLGAGRLISDGMCYGTIYDVGVFEEYQGV